MAADSPSGPLRGWRVAVTRPVDSAKGLTRRLERLGAEPLPAPLLAIAPPPDPGPLAAALARLARYDWIVFTSANAVRAVVPLVDRRRLGRPGGPRVGAVGPVTALALEAAGIPVHLVPARFDGATLAAAGEIAAGERVLLPRSSIAPDGLPEALEARGVLVDSVTAYTVGPGSGGPVLDAALAAGTVDCVTLYSPSAADAFRRLATSPLGSRPLVVAVGPTTAAAALAAGIPVARVADRFDDEGVIGAILELASLQPLEREVA